MFILSGSNRSRRGLQRSRGAWWVVAVTLLLPLSLMPTDSRAETLVMGSIADYPPYVMRTEHGFAGLDVAVVKAAFALTGHDVRVVVLPPRRMFRAIENGEVDGILGAVAPHRMEQGNVLPPNTVVVASEPHSALGIHLLTRRDSAFATATLAEVSGFRLGYVAGMKQLELLPIFARNEVVAFPSHEALIQGLLQGRVDVVVDDQLLIQAQAARLGLNDALVSIAPLAEMPVYVVFSRNRLGHKVERVATEFSQALQQLKASGEFGTIHEQAMAQPTLASHP